MLSIASNEHATIRGRIFGRARTAAAMPQTVAVICMADPNPALRKGSRGSICAVNWYLSFRSDMILLAASP